jgi:hypothetical protein
MGTWHKRHTSMSETKVNTMRMENNSIIAKPKS